MIRARTMTPIVAIACFIPLSAMADDAATVLPGVDIKAGDVVVGATSSPSPMNEPMTRPDSSAVEVGDWDVKISGSITVDISAGKRVPTVR